MQANTDLPYRKTTKLQPLISDLILQSSILIRFLFLKRANHLSILFQPHDNVAVPFYSKHLLVSTSSAA